ncbi:MAG: YraN family protein [Thermoguttaceae bacterium]|jgi:putative endonuclease
MGFRNLVSAWRRRLFPPRTLGQRGERAAAAFLKRAGLRVLVHSSRLWPGEIDLVALDGRTVVFVEVKTRTSAEAGQPWEAVDQKKQRKLTTLAVTFLKRHGLLECSARFDVVAVTWPSGKGRPAIEHFPNAFDAVGQWELYS